MFSKKLLNHTTSWAIFIAYEVTVALLLGSKAGFWQFAAFYILNILLFYCNAHRILGDTSRTKPLLLLSVLVVAELALYVLIAICLEILVGNLNLRDASYSEIRTDLIRAIWRGIYFIGLSTAYWFALRTIRATKEADQSKILQLQSEQKKVAIEKQNIQLQNAHLQAQVNPHFILNALNYVYSSVEPYSDKAGESILLLADIMRYALSDPQGDGKVELQNELTHIERYIELHQLKNDNQLSMKLDINVNEDALIKRVPPLLLFTFVENVFKHGNLTNMDKPGRVSILSKDGNFLHFHSENLKRRSNVQESHRIGINNALTRLDNYYGKENFDLAVNEIDGKFILDLKLHL